MLHNSNHYFTANQVIVPKKRKSIGDWVCFSKFYSLVDPGHLLPGKIRTSIFYPHVATIIVCSYVLWCTVFLNIAALHHFVPLVKIGSFVAGVKRKHHYESVKLVAFLGGIVFRDELIDFSVISERSDCKQKAPAINKSEHSFLFSFPHAQGTHKRTGTIKSQYVVLMCPKSRCDWGDAKSWWRKRFVLMSVTGRWYYLCSLRWFVVSAPTIATVRVSGQLEYAFKLWIQAEWIDMIWP